MFVLKNRSFFIALLIYIIIFISLAFLTKNVVFMQNDDWVYYENVKNFLSNNFRLNSITAPTFYSQGLIGALFSLVFGFANLPFLTLFISVATVFSAFYLIRYVYNRTFVSSLLGSFLILFNPLFFYSIFGFMTDNYLLFYMSFSILFFELFIKKNHLIFLRLSLLWASLAFFAKQSGIVLFLAFLAYFFYFKRKKDFYITFIYFGILMCFYYLGFPLTSEMIEKTPAILNLANTKYIFTLFVVILSYTIAFLLPLLIVNFYKYKKISVNILVFVILVSSIGTSLLFSYFQPVNFFASEFPYLLNTFTNKGFFPSGLSGNKYHFIGFYDLFRYWEIAIIIGVFVLLFRFIIDIKEGFYLTFKKKITIHHFLLFFYVVLMMVTPVVYDRYIMPIILFVVFIFFKAYKGMSNINNLIISAFIGFLFVLDFFILLIILVGKSMFGQNLWN